MPDFIVVGAGSAGAVIASRLSADPSTQVLLLEAGSGDRPSAAVIPAAFSKLFETEADWNFRTEPEPRLDHRRLYWPRGKMLGGSSAMNAMIWTRGAQGDFDEWERLGNPGWGYQEMAPAFDAAERAAADRVGIAISRLRTVNPVTQAMVAAAIGSGIPPNDGFENGLMDGAGLFRVSQRQGRRCSTAVGYLDPVRTRRNLTIITGAQVVDLLFASGRAVGVRYLGPEGSRLARGRVVLAAGAIGSPTLLLRSGIGPADDLARAGIAVVQDLPGVGRNLQDHLSIGLMFHCRRAVTLAGAERLDHLLNYLLLRRGPLSSNVAEGGAFVRIDRGADRPDIELIFAPSFFVDHGRGNPPGHGFTIAAILQRPGSRGAVRLGPGPDSGPLIQPNYLADGADLRRLVAGLELAATIAERPELDAFRGARLFPEPGEGLEGFVRRRAETLYHPVGTCRMGGDPDSVVDHRLAVHGIDDLWVADASVMPAITTGHPNAAAVAIGERAARFCVGASGWP